MAERRSLKKDKAKEWILTYLKSLYDSQQKGNPILYSDVQHCKNKTALAQYIDLNQPQTTLQKDRVSESRIGDAIDELVREKKIELDGGYKYIPPKEEFYERFPILNCANQITVTPLPVDSVAYFRVPANYSKEIAAYLNSCFLPDEIHTISMENIIMCICMKSPKVAAYGAKPKPFKERILNKLNDFTITTVSKFDPHLGYSEDEFKELQRKCEREKANAAKTEPYGGKITDPPKRNFKKKNV